MSSFAAAAQSNHGAAEMKADEEAQYMLKILYQEAQLSEDQFKQVKRILLSDVQNEIQVKEDLKESKAEKRETLAPAMEEERDASMSQVLSSSQYEIYLDIKENLAEKISQLGK